jgi:hypothetical protein
VLWGFTAVPQAGLNALYFNNLFTYYDSIIARNGQKDKQRPVGLLGYFVRLTELLNDVKIVDCFNIMINLFNIKYYLI